MLAAVLVVLAVLAGTAPAQQSGKEVVFGGAISQTGRYAEPAALARALGQGRSDGAACLEAWKTTASPRGD